ncbi:MAG: hypothetical protein QG629_644 [Patescibacteria group bacterium]|nr:CBS domain-containing protein [Candidatus Saccharibacteria bacterium]MDQ5963562.1 hypothetical protein [Patescibacteria group bacterium]
MTLFILGLLCLLLAVVFAAMFRVYNVQSANELKRQARKGEAIAGLLYKAGAYGEKTTFALMALCVLCAYIGVLLFEAALGTLLTSVTILVLLVAAAKLITGKGGVSKAAIWLTSKVSPVLAWTIERVHPAFDWVYRLLRKLFPVYMHSGMYEKQDLVRLLEKQRQQPDNRIAKGEIDLITHALSFGDKTVADALVPKRVVISASETEDIGPLLMDRLHRSGHSRFPIYEGKRDNITGVLYLRELIEHKSGGAVRDVMRRKVTYVHEDFTLYQTLQAFIKTKQHLFVVVNEFEEYVGIITIEDVLERVIGKLIVDEFDRYDDLRAVAAAAAKKEHAKIAKNHAEAHVEPTEVV